MNRLCYRIIFSKKRGIVMAAAASFGGVELVGAQIVADPNAAGNRRPVVEAAANGPPLVRITTPNAAGVSHNQYNQYGVGAGGAILNNAVTITGTQQGGLIDGNPNLRNGSARLILNEVTGTSPSQLRGFTEVGGQRAEVIIANPNGISCSGCSFINTSRGMLTTGTPVFGADGSLDAFRVTRGGIDIGTGGLNAGNLDQLDLIARSVQVNGELWASRLNVIAGANQVRYADLGVQVIQGDAGRPTVGIDVAQLGGMYANKIRLVGTEAGVGVGSLGNIAAQAGDLSINSAGKVTLSGNTTAAGNMAVSAAEGIVNAGVLYGRQAVVLDSQGQIGNSGTIAAQGDLGLTGGSIASTGTLAAGMDQDGKLGRTGNLTVTAGGMLSATGYNAGAGNVALQGGSLDLSGATTHANYQLAMTAGSGDVRLAGATTTAGGQVSIDARAGTIYNDAAPAGRSAQIQADAISIVAAGLSNQGSLIKQSGSSSASFRIGGTLNNRGGSVEASGALTLNAGSFDNTRGRAVSLGAEGLTAEVKNILTNVGGTAADGTALGLIGGNGKVSIVAGTLGNAGTISATQDLNLETGTLENNAGTLTSGAILTATASGTLTNKTGTIAAQQVFVTARDLGNQSGTITQTGSGTTIVRTAGLLDNSGGTIQTNADNLTMISGALTNDGGKVAHAGTSTLRIETGALSNRSGSIGTNGAGSVIAGAAVNSGSISAAGALSVDATSMNNADGSVIAGGALTVLADSFDNSRGYARSLNADGLKILVKNALTNIDGSVIAGGALTISAGSFNNSRGYARSLNADGLKILVTDALTNVEGSVIAGGALTVSAGSFDNSRGRAISLNADGLKILVKNALTNAGGSAADGTALGVIGGNGNTTVAAGTLSNSGTISAMQDLGLTAVQTLDNSGGTLAAGAALTASAGGRLTNTSGTIAGKQVSLAASGIVNQSGLIAQTGNGATTVRAAGLLDNARGTIETNADNLTIASAAFSNDGGRVSHAGGGAMLVETGSMSNRGGTINTNGDGVVTAGATVNSGSITALRTLNIDAASLNNNGGLIASNAALAVKAGSQLSNAGGLLRAGSPANQAGATISATALDNSGGTIDAGTLALEATTLVNQAGLIAQTDGAGTADIAVRQTLDNRSGTIGIAARDVRLAPQTLRNDGGRIDHAGNGILTIETGALTNDGGRIASNGAESISAASVSNRAGRMSAVGAQSVTSGSGIDNSVLNGKGGIIGGAQVTLAAEQGLINNQGGVIEGAGGGVTIAAQALKNAAGRIQNLGAGSLAVTATQSLGNDGGIIGGKGNVTVSGGAINNTGGILGAEGDLGVVSGATLANDGGAIQALGNVTLSAQGRLSNGLGKIQALGAASSLSVSAADIVNHSGKIINAGTGNTVLSAAARIENVNPSAVSGAGLIGGNGNVSVITPVLSNTQGAQVVAGGALTLFTPTGVDNNGGRLTSAGALVMEQPAATLSNVGGAISGANITLTAASVDNTNGQIANPAGGGAVTVSTGQLINTGGTIASAQDLRIAAAALAGNGKIIGGRDARVDLQGDYLYQAANRITANRSLYLSTTGTLANAGMLEAAGNITLNAATIVNQAGAGIASGNLADPTAGTTTLGGGDIANAGRIEGNTVNTFSGTFGNTGTVIGNTVTLSANTIANDGPAALIAGVEQVNLWARGALDNRNGALLYSLGDLNIAADAGKDANGYLVNRTAVINNLSSTIETDGTLNVAADRINNVRENVRTESVTVSDEIYTMRKLPWLSPQAPNVGAPERNSNTLRRNAYYLDPASIVSVTPVITPDGYVVQKAILNLSTNDSVFQWMRGGATYWLPNDNVSAQYGSQSRVTPAAGTQVIFFYERADNQTNPDSVADISAWSKYDNHIVQNSLESITYSNQYGRCTTNCVRIEALADYTDPSVFINHLTDRVRVGGPDPGVYPIEVERRAHQTVTETRMAAGSGMPATIASGGAMHLAVGTQLNNDNGRIAAGGNLTIDGAPSIDGHNNSKVVNTGTQLTRIYTFDNTSGYGSSMIEPSPPVEWFTWSNPSITQNIGTVGGTITSNRTVAITAGQVRNTSVATTSGPSGASAGSLGLGEGIEPLSLASGNRQVAGVSTGSANSPAGVSTVARPGVAAMSAAPQAPLVTAVTTGTAVAAVTVPGATGAARTVSGVRAGVLNPVLPVNGLYRIVPRPEQKYLVETDPRFTTYSKFVSSDYMLERLGIDPQKTQKRLGDGFYEQRLIMNQVTGLTGQRYLTGYASAEEEYKALMTNGAAFAKQFNLMPGVALSDAQMAALTSDIVWLVSQEVTLPDGSQESVLAPQVYLARNTNLLPTGAMIAGDAVSIAGTDITNDRGVLAGSRQLLLNAEHDVVNLGGSIIGGDVGILAGNDIINQSLTSTSTTTVGNNVSTVTAASAVGKIAATGNLLMSADRNLFITGAHVSAGGNARLAAGDYLSIGGITTGSQYTLPGAKGSSSYLSQDSLTMGSTIAAGGNLSVTSLGDIHINASTLSSGQNMLVAGAGNVSITNAIDSSSYASASTTRNRSESVKRYTESVVGSKLEAGGNAIVLAGARQDMAGNITLNTDKNAPGMNLLIQGSTVTAGMQAGGQGSAVLRAAGNATLAEATTHDSFREESRSSSKSFLSRRSNHDLRSFSAESSQGSLVSGEQVSIGAGNDLNIRGSAVVGSGDVSLNADNNINITASRNTVRESNLHEEKRSGLMGTGGIGFSIGSREQKRQFDGASITEGQNRSTIGSIGGNVIMTAGGDAAIRGSDLIANRVQGDMLGATGHIDIQAQNISIDPGRDAISTNTTQEAKSSSLTIALVGTPLDTVRNVRDAQKNPSKFGRLRGTVEEIGASAMTMPQVAISFDRSQSRSKVVTDDLINTGSSLAAAGDIRLRATGNGAKDAVGDITVTGSTLHAGGLVQLDAARNILLQAATDRYTESSDAVSSSTHFSTAAVSIGDAMRHIGGGPNNSGVGAFPYGKAYSSDTANTAASVQSATVVTGENVILNSRTGDIRIAGSDVTATQDLSVVAQQGQITIASGEDSRTHREDHVKKLLGDLGKTGSTGTSNTVGVYREHSTLDASQNQQSTIRSQLSAGRNLTLDAHDNLKVQGADLRAGKDLTAIGRNILLDVGQDSSRVVQTTEMSLAGVTASLSGYAVEAAQALDQAAKAAEQKGNKRLAALYGSKAALVVYNGMGTSGNGAAIKATVSIGSKSAESRSEVGNLQTEGSTLAAGQTVTLLATGSGGKDSQGKAIDGDIVARGAQIVAKNAVLVAARDIVMQSAQDLTRNSSTNRSSNASIGIGFGLGGQQNGFTLELAAAQAGGMANGESVTNQNAHLTVSDTVTLKSGRDTSLLGAQVIGNTVNGTVGRDLNVVSQQDTDTFHSTQDSSGISLSLCVPPFCFGTTAAVSANVANANTDSTYQSVKEQSGIYAGQGGFNITVQGNTDLKGSVIASTAAAARNRLVTGTLTTSDLANKAEYRSDSSNFSFSYSGGQSAASGISGAGSMARSVTGNLANNAAGNMMGAQIGHASGITKSAISPGSIMITDDAAQQQKTGKTAEDTIASLNRDTTTANGAINKIFDQAKLQREQEERQVLSQIAQQATPALYNRIGNLAKEQTKPYEEAAVQKEKYQLALQEEADPEKRTLLEQQIAKADATINQYQAQYDLWKEGGLYKIALHGLAGGALTRLTGGSAAAGALAGAVNEAKIPLLNELMQGHSVESQKLIHELASVATGAAIGGRESALYTLMADVNNRQLHPDERKWAKENAAKYQQYLAGKTGETVTLEEAYQRLLSAGYAVVDDAATKAGKSDETAKQFLNEAAPKTLFVATAAERNNPFLNGNAGGSYTPEQQARFGSSRPGEQASAAVTKAMQYVGQSCTDCRAKYAAIDNAIVSLQEARLLYQDVPGSVKLINQQIDQLKAGITKSELVRGMAGAVSDKDKGIAALLLGTPSRVIAGTATGEFLERVTLTQATKDVRAGLPSDPRRSGNVAAAQIDIEGLPAQMAAHSDINQAGKGVVGKGSGNFTSMELPNAQGVPVQRSTDSEYKILDNIADRLGNNTSATGTVKLVTERPACDSCLDVANQFRAKYPNIDVQIYDNNGVMLTKTPKVTPYFKPENVGKH